MGFRIWRTVLNTLIVPMNHHYPRVMSKLMEADGEENDLIKQGSVITKSNLTWNQFDCQQGLIKFVHAALITIRFCVDSRPSQEPKDHSNTRPLIGCNAPVKASDWQNYPSLTCPLSHPAIRQPDTGAGDNILQEDLAPPW